MTRTRGNKWVTWLILNSHSKGNVRSHQWNIRHFYSRALQDSSNQSNKYIKWILCILPWNFSVKMHPTYKNTWICTEKEPRDLKYKAKKNREKRHCIRDKVENQPIWDWKNSDLHKLRSACVPWALISLSYWSRVSLLSFAAVKPFNLAFRLMARSPQEGAGLMTDALQHVSWPPAPRTLGFPRRDPSLFPGPVQSPACLFRLHIRKLKKWQIAFLNL